MSEADEQETPAGESRSQDQDYGREHDDQVPGDVYRDMAVLSMPFRSARIPPGVPTGPLDEDGIIDRPRSVPEWSTAVPTSSAPAATPATDFDTFVRENFERIKRAVGVLCRDDPSQAEDITQGAMIAACKHWPRISTMESPLAYVTKIAWRLGLAWLRAKERERQACTALAAVAQPHHGSAESVIARVDLERAFLRLSRERQELLGLSMSGLSPNEIAANLGIPAGTVRTRLLRARRALTTLLEETEHAEETKEPISEEPREGQA
ncbi:sigma-70 family RNA polymerase sigma factor [Streptomyces sp. NPDC093510]|uniref:RNA polymerase sigma factor n=1 Tax=Streptomyces sp. NPDC093510 TaxID=3155199 RepID=UPI00342A5ED6